mmetsp:Transcript_12704/g.25904  ORF Transcript_12704/g.25904 Transcript_12704/m.25904 type:complete len:122 (+) Transcript_12704:18-383(+)
MMMLFSLVVVAVICILSSSHTIITRIAVCLTKSYRVQSRDNTSQTSCLKIINILFPFHPIYECRRGCHCLCRNSGSRIIIIINVMLFQIMITIYLVLGIANSIITTIRIGIGPFLMLPHLP